jgi:prepilin-type N-terminal cleavage/methylation domain-containing protein
MKNRGHFNARRRGFTLIEVTLAMMIFLAMVLMFAAVFPLAVRGSIFSNQYAQAVALCQHKMDQLRQEGFTNLGNSGSILYNDGVIDQSAAPTAFPYQYTFTNCDNLASFFPSGGTPPVGSVYIQQDSHVASGYVYDVTVTITWFTPKNGVSSYSLNAMIVKNEPNNN